MTSFGENSDNKSAGEKFSFHRLKVEEKKGFNPTSLPTKPFKFCMDASSARKDFSFGTSSTSKLLTFGTSSTNPILDKNEKDDEEVFEDAKDGEATDKYTTDTRISVDVRGQIFKVSRDTLQKMVFFRNIIVSDENISSIFIDRSPSSFSHLLDLLVYESMDPSIDDFTKKQMILDMDYFGISAPDCMTSIGDKKEKIVDKKRTPICIGGYSILGIDDETIRDLDDLVKENQPYVGHENSRRHHYHNGGRCCMNACLQGVKFHPRINMDGHMDRCVILKTESATKGVTYRCSIHRERKYDSDK